MDVILDIPVDIVPKVFTDLFCVVQHNVTDLESIPNVMIILFKEARPFNCYEFFNEMVLLFERVVGKELLKEIETLYMRILVGI